MSEDTIANSFRRWGYLQAQLDYLGRIPKFEHSELDNVSGAEAQRYRDIYCGPIGVEFMHIPYPERTKWVQERMESEPAKHDQEYIFDRILLSDSFERFLHTRYVGTKRFSLEGLTTLIPLLDSILDRAAQLGFEYAMIGMSHRGRLNVMLHVTGVPAAAIFSGFEDVDPRSVLGSGDVKYHKGATGPFTGPSGSTIGVRLASNPSHLEAVNPVMMGRARARQERLGDEERSRVLTILIHGDAAFAGQGVNAETLNYADLRGFRVGGTVHIIANNLIGFTARPESLHSTRFASSLMHRLPTPIFHVNAEEPDAVYRVGEMAMDYRKEFLTDVLIDLIGYRRYGHSEIDDPTITHPELYEKIQQRPFLFERYGSQIGLSSEEIERREQNKIEIFSKELEQGRSMNRMPSLFTLPDYWDSYFGGPYDPTCEVDTAISKERLSEIVEKITSWPNDFHIHKKVQRVIEQRREMGEGKRQVDWGMAEALAFGSLLWDGTMVRLSGQDSRRGTFNHRHAALYDAETGAEYLPLRHLHEHQGTFDVYDSQLSEAAAVGFEYGFSRDYPEALVLWEAQFGDFANGAQIIIDQFISAGEDKWGLLAGLVMLLPHGYEGQGPEHSSARLERYLQLAAEDNMQVCSPSTASQYYHLLRRQVLRKWRKPLIVMTPKGMLRAAASSSPVSEFTSGAFYPVLGDPEYSDARKIIVCTGKIAHELAAERQRREDKQTAIVRLEQIYPLPEEQLSAVFASFPNASTITWVQEEPANMGALFFVRPHLERLAAGRNVTTVRRSASASPATGSPKAHSLEQEALLKLAFANYG